MRTRPSPAHQDAVTRRLELLRAEIARDWRAGAAETEAELDPAVGSDWWPEHAAGPPEPGAPDPEPAAPLVPVPGRHAARRSLVLRAVLPEAVRGRVGVGPWQLAVVAIVVALALAVTCWWLVRARPSVAPMPAAATAPALVSLPAASAATAAAPVDEADASAGPSAEVTVDVEGKVRHPGIAVLPTGSRVVDAVQEAGGALRRRFLGGLNLAAVLTDGQQVMVGASTAAGTSSSAGAPTGSTGTLVNLNTATAEELDTLPEVGPVTAQAILDWRTQNGGFSSVQELLEVDGIGEVTLAKLEPYVTV